jgi:hypothetical protein
MLGGASNFFRRRAQSFSNAARKEERGRAVSAPDIADLPSPDENADAGEGAFAPDILPSHASSTSTIIPFAPLFKTRGVVQSHSNSLTLTRTHSNTDSNTLTRSRSRSPFRTLSRTLSRSHSRSQSKDKDRGRPTSSLYRDNSPGSLDLDVKSLKSLEKAKEKEKEREQEQMETHHHAFGLPSGWWERTQFEVMPRPWKDSDVGGGDGEKVDGKDGKGKGREVREPKRQGSLAIATLEQAEGWDVTRKVSLEFRVFIFFVFGVSCFYLFLFCLEIHFLSLRVFFGGSLNLDGEPLAEVPCLYAIMSTNAQHSPESIHTQSV